ADLRIPLQEVRQERRGDPESGRSAAREVRVLLGPLGEARLPELVPAPWRRMVQQRLQLRVRFIWLVRLVWLVRVQLVRIRVRVFVEGRGRQALQVRRRQEGRE